MIQPLAITAGIKTTYPFITFRMGHIQEFIDRVEVLVPSCAASEHGTPYPSDAEENSPLPIAVIHPTIPACMPSAAPTPFTQRPAAINHSVSREIFPVCSCSGCHGEPLFADRLRASSAIMLMTHRKVVFAAFKVANYAIVKVPIKSAESRALFTVTFAGQTGATITHHYKSMARMLKLVDAQTGSIRRLSVRAHFSTPFQQPDSIMQITFKRDHANALVACMRGSATAPAVLVRVSDLRLAVEVAGLNCVRANRTHARLMATPQLMITQQPSLSEVSRVRNFPFARMIMDMARDTEPIGHLITQIRLPTVILERIRQFLDPSRTTIGPCSGSLADSNLRFLMVGPLADSNLLDRIGQMLYRS